MRIVHATPCFALNGAVHIRLIMSFFCKNVISFNFPSFENNFIFHIVESVPERMANLFSNTHAVPGLPTSKLRPIQTCLLLGNL